MLQVTQSLGRIEAVFDSIHVLSDDLKLLNGSIIPHVTWVFVLNDLDVTLIFFISPV